VRRDGYDERSAAILVARCCGGAARRGGSIRSLYSFYSLHDIVLTRPLRRPFVGFDNYLRIFDDERFWLAVWRTTVYTVVTVAATTLLALLVALLLNEAFPGQRLLSALLLVPWATPSVVNGLMWKWIYDPTYGLLNGLLCNSACWSATASGSAIPT
jgi:multiple sugar transport system permease protein